MKKKFANKNIFFCLNVFNTAKKPLVINTGWTQKEEKIKDVRDVLCK